MALKSVNNPKENLCKRVLGVEGDIIYNPLTSQTTLIPKGHIWIQGDNTSNSTDSRHYGPIPYNMLIGKIFMRVVPFHQFKFVRNDLSFLSSVSLPIHSVDLSHLSDLSDLSEPVIPIKSSDDVVWILKNYLLYFFHVNFI